MRVKCLSVLFACCFCLGSFATPLSNEPYNKPLDLTEIFYSDVENQLLFIDFAAIDNKISKLNILKSENLMMEDDVTDLPSNTIYELNLDVLRQGEYTIELECEGGLKIRKDILIE